MNECNEDLEERRRSEIEFVSAAYEPSEAWCDSQDSSWIVNRRLVLPATPREGSGEKDNDESASLILHMFMPLQYPDQEALEITGHVEDDRRPTSRLFKTCHDALPHLLEACREIANSLIGDEAILGVLGRADEWIQEDWPRYLSLSLATRVASNIAANCAARVQSSTLAGIHGPNAVLTRLLIYSHHIISKKKRADMKHLANKYDLTGYIKIGWPGLMILEGWNSACHDFYDEIRRWNWKYLVVRGEMQESAVVSDTSDEGDVLEDRLNSLRRFEKFVEVDDMSVVATACREADLEDLFRTSMKVYNNDNSAVAISDSTSTLSSGEVKPYGVLAHVDHMNDAKGYVKWLRKNCSELDVCLAIKQLQEESNTDTSNRSVGRRTNIIVCLVGEKTDVSLLLKRWRTSRVDVDGRGKPCLERMMTVLVEGFLERAPSSRMDWEHHQQVFQANNIATTSTSIQDGSNPMDVVRAIGGDVWVDALQALHSTAAR